MSLTQEKIESRLPEMITADNLTQDILKSLCFNCDLRKSCSWKETRKLYCEHFQ